MGEQACSTFAQITGLPSVEAYVGRSVIAAMEVDRNEAKRRENLGIGAITSTPLLHGLWLLPHGMVFSLSRAHQRKAELLRDAPYAANAIGDQFQRTYQPPGTVKAIAVADRRIPSGVRRVAPWVPKIFERWVVLPEAPKRMSALSARLTSMHGIGVIAPDEHGEPQTILSAASATLGIPHVYRWWIAEVVWEAMIAGGAQTPETQTHRSRDEIPGQ